MTQNWNAEKLVASITEFDWTLATPITDESWTAYLQFFDLPQNDRQLQHFAGHQKIAGFEIMIQSWRPVQPVGTALLVHGLYDHTGLYRQLVRYCLQQNYQVVAFDLPGHGLSSGLPAGIDSFQQYDAILHALITDTQRYLPAPIHAFGQSTGGAILINYALTHRLTQQTNPFASINLIAPLIRPREWTKLRCVFPILKYFIKGLKRGQSINSHDQNFLDLVWYQDPLQARFLPVNWLQASLDWANAIVALPSSEVRVNIVQGDKDGTVDWRYNLKVLTKKFPNHSLRIIAKGRHHMVGEQATIQQAMWDFFTQQNR